MDKPKKLILDYSKWRCGGDGENKVGDGDVALLNNKGFMCCLGQWHLQLGSTEQELLNNGEPADLSSAHYPFSFEEYDATENYKDVYNTKLSRAAMGINDDPDTLSDEKIHALTELLSEEGIELEVINKPDIING